jgi:hypothetical protein
MYFVVSDDLDIIDFAYYIACRGAKGYKDYGYFVEC